MTAILALVIVLAAMSLGDIVSIKTKAWIPSVFVTAIVFLFGFWWLFPKDVISTATLGMPVAGLGMYLLVTHMGTLMNIKELISQWRTVVISIAGICGIMALLLTVGLIFFDKQTAIAGGPPLSGGIVAAIIIKEAATALGNDKLAILAILIYVVQGFVGYPLTSILLKKEGNRLLKDLKNNKENVVEKIVSKESERKTLIPNLPEKYNTIYVVLLKLAFVAYLADCFTKFVNNTIFQNTVLSPFVTCLIFGIIAAELGLVDRQALNKANSFGWMITLLMAFIYEGLNKATPEMLLEVLLPLVEIIIIGVAGLLIFAFIIGKILKESPYMSLCIALNALYGFPPNFILTNEVIKSLTNDNDESEYLTNKILPKMLIGGFTSVTIASVLIAGIFSKFL
ncbi:hypothetical protein KST12_08075 [Fusobacterium polymorphum]|jgi:membrane protein|uniref:Na+/glutamate symporter n=1 Tax=Fusobacterium nucleatum subsp. polymorphum TaxID=76857 RepID=A0AAC8WEZ6_FUSNP|nr:hypothetical protein [Fusobacterium polymorphum]ALM93502.1 hypothetical protein RO02_02390 [Fusobacterium polymorphum]WRL73025.1 hypothetical protein VKN77_00055 [Fusobacterium polymorphum]